jgi:lipoprotein-anchoring transpeptidase ErfK/SrfK
MDPNQTAALNNLELAEKAQQQGQKELARQYAVKAAEQAPELEEVWLMMASLAAPRASMKFFQQALQVNPNSLPAQKGLADVQAMLSNGPGRVEPDPESLPPLEDVLDPSSANEQPEESRNRSKWIFVALILLLICLVGGGLIFGLNYFNSYRYNPLSDSFFVTQTQLPQTGQPVFVAPSETITVAPSSTVSFASPTPVKAEPTQTVDIVLSEIVQIMATQTASFAMTETSQAAPSPTAHFIAVETATPAPTVTVTITETATPTLPPIFTATGVTTEQASPTPLPSDTPEPTLPALPTQQAAEPGSTSSNTGSTSASGGKHWIDVDLTNQMVYAYEGDTVVNSFLVSTGAAPRLTVTGSFHIYERYVKANMWGPGYFLPDVPYTMYFYKGFALHGTYWHSNFGTPMSHGCVNLSIPDAEWLYYWSTMGTLVKVHY